MKVVLIILIIIATSMILAVEFHGGEGFSGVSKIESSDSNWMRTIERAPGFPSGGLRIGKTVFIFSRDFGFTIIDANTFETLAHLDTFHAEDLAMRIETLDLFIADGINGVQVYKYLAPWLVKHKQEIFLRGWANQIEVWENYVIVSTLHDGVVLIKDTGKEYQIVSRYGKKNIMKFQHGNIVNSLSVSDGYVYIAAGMEGIIILTIENDELIESQKINTPYALDIAIKNDLIAISHPTENKVSILSKMKGYEIDSEILFENSPKNIEIYKDWETGDDYLATSFIGSGMKIINLTSPEEPVNLGGYYYGLIRNWQ